MGRTVINETENKQTVIMNDSPEGVEGGYFDSEEVWHEFGGGGSADDITPMLTITVINSIAENYLVSPDDDAFLKIENNHITYYGGTDLSVNYGETKVFESIIPSGFAGIFVFDFDSKLQAGDGTTYVTSNLVNCVNRSGALFITDPTQNASCTLTYKLGA